MDSVIGLLKKTLYIFSGHKRKTLVFLILSFVVAAIFEMLGVGLIMPFIAILDKPALLNENTTLKFFFENSGAQDYKGFFIISSILLVIFYIIKNILLGFLTYWQSAFLSKAEGDVASNLLKSYIYMPYKKYLTHNNAELVNNVTIESSMLFAGFIKPLFFIISDLLIVFCIILLLMLVAPIATITAISSTLITAYLFYFLTRKKLKSLGDSRHYHREKMVQWVNQAFGSIKEITILGRRKFFENSFRTHIDETIKIQTFYETVTQLPRLLIETTGVAVVIAVTVVLVSTEDNFLPKLSLFAMAAFRLMPAMQRITTCITKVKYYSKTLDSIYKTLNTNNTEETSDSTQLKFNDIIKFNNVSFSYGENTGNVLSEINLDIKKGESVGIIGKSGAGKSTLIDILLGLLKPNSGSVTVDNINIEENLKSWRSKISYMPQSVYLTDDTIKNNVALGVQSDEIDENLVWECLKKANIYDVIEKMPERLESRVGDRGLWLSGGQRQRIGIARALYNKPEILVLDEATTGLDPETEQMICETFIKLSDEITIIAISHQAALTNIAHTVYKLADGVLSKQKGHK